MAFKFVPRDPAAIAQRAKDKGGSYDGPIVSTIPQWKPKEGKNRIRIIPWSSDPTRLGLGLDLWVHSSVGADNASYICSSKMNGSACAVCDERQRITDEEQSKELRPYKRVVCWIVDRAAEDEGPQIMLMGAKMEAEINGLSLDEAGETLVIDDPEAGYDVEFSRDGKGLKTQYSGTRIARRATPIADSPKRVQRWLDFCNELHPIDTCLQYYPFEYIAKLLRGASPKRAADDDEPAPKPRTRAETKKDDDESAPKPRKPSATEPLDDDEPAPAPKPRPKPAPLDDDEAAPKPKPKAKPSPPPFDDEDDSAPVPKSKPRAQPPGDDDD